jgi:hypothetical protein
MSCNVKVLISAVDVVCLTMQCMIVPR